MKLDFAGVFLGLGHTVEAIRQRELQVSRVYTPTIYILSLNCRNSCLGVPPQGHTEGDGLSLRDFSAKKYPAPRKECLNNMSFDNSKILYIFLWNHF